MTFTAACQAGAVPEDGNLHDQKIQASSVDPKHFLTLLRSQTALIRQIPLPQGLASGPCNLSAFGPVSAVTVRKLIPITSRSTELVGSSRRLVLSLQNYLSNPASAFQLADAIVDFCHTVRMSRFTAPSLLQSLIDHEAETGILLPLTNALKALTQNNQSQVLACIEQLRGCNLFRDTVSLSMSEIACSKVRRHLHSLQKLSNSCKNHASSGNLQSYLPVSSAMLLLLETTTQIVAWLQRFLSQSYVADEYEDGLMSNLCLLSGLVVSSTQDLLLASAADDSRVALSCFWISVKALIDLMAGEEQFGDEPLQGKHTGRQLLFHYLKKMQSARNKIREYLD